ncbi:hypothetical protein [Clostridium sp. HBUAS56017]|uniref:hypothetical protein n=1 Tax=Clostridium sp. HBUAS56017 TaxID=2571128 RepID=UPI00117845C2|nr:hypothetical protein [Clostridium sp. HBUAS56017]
MNKKIKILLMFFTISLIVISIGVPNFPYKIPGKLENSNYVELELAISQSTGGPGVLSGNENIIEYGKKMGYKNLNTSEVNLTEGNPIYKTIVSGMGYRYNDYMKYHYFRVYGEFESEPDKYGVLTFKVAEWYPLKKYVAIKDTIEWDKYKIVNSILIKCNIALLIIIIIASKAKK